MTAKESQDSVAERHSAAAVIIPPRAIVVLNEITTTQRDRPDAEILRCGRIGCSVAAATIAEIRNASLQRLAAIRTRRHARREGRYNQRSSCTLKRHRFHVINLKCELGLTIRYRPIRETGGGTHNREVQENVGCSDP
jgi:hypothetical protein